MNRALLGSRLVAVDKAKALWESALAAGGVPIERLHAAFAGYLAALTRLADAVRNELSGGDR